VVTRSADRVAEPRLTARQRRELAAATALLGEAAGVRAYAVGRTSARWSAGARWLVGGFAALFVFMLVVAHVILFPGGLVIFGLYEMVKPRRGIVVTPAGLSELKLSALNGRPSSVLATTAHAGLFDPRTQPEHGRTTVWIGDEAISLKDPDLARLRAAASAAAAVAAASVQQGWGTLPPPPPPLPSTEASDRLPGWREATVMWVVVHLFVGLVVSILLITAAIAVPSVLGRDTTDAPPAAALLFATFVGGIVGWMCFVYVRRPLGTRLRLLAVLLGGALVLGAVGATLGAPHLPS
jgi:hypothetical protein